ncbi:MAG TPA: DUF2378 family protein [Sandaracinaceae bacterium LLY-WYZ-13_1]|nr:DUF2378 family protein [Sandaracinaceae bacterium LLY-WYZ-13_1]
MRESAFGTHPPPFDQPVDLDAHLAALPLGASAKGLYLRDPVRRAEAARPGVDLFALADVPKRRLLPFFDYPYGELMRLLVAATGVIWPSLPQGEGMRRLGRGAYEALLSQQVGRVIFAAFGNDFSRVAAVGARGWQVSVSFGSVRYVDLGPGHGAYRFREFPAFLETYQVGVVEGAMSICGVEGEVRTKLENIGEGVLEFWWET